MTVHPPKRSEQDEETEEKGVRPLDETDVEMLKSYVSKTCVVRM